MAVGYLAAALRRMREEPVPATVTLDAAAVEKALARALERASSAPIRQLVEKSTRAKLDRAVRDVRRLADYASGDISNARLYVRAYAALAEPGLGRVDHSIGDAARSACGSGTSVSVASVRSRMLATETAFSSATRVTFVGSMIPASTRST